MENTLIKRVTLIAGICLVSLSILAVGNQKDFFAERYNLRCYGPVTAEELPTLKKYGDYKQLRISTRNKAKAELLISKLISDFTTLPTVVRKLV